MDEKQVERVAHLYYSDHADTYELPQTWKELPTAVKDRWRDFARRRLESDS